MKNTISILAVAAAFLASCQSNSTQTTTTIDSTLTSKDTSSKSSQCYVYTKNRDTATLSLNWKGNEVTGNLSYSLFEKDKNRGTVEGTVKGDTIIANYTFQSEGMESIRQVVWLKTGDGLLEGFGEVEDAGGKTRFKNIGTLKFGESILFTKTNCP